MTDLEKLEHIHSTLQEHREQSEHVDMIDKSFEFVEELREPYFEGTVDG